MNTTNTTESFSPTLSPATSPWMQKTVIPQSALEEEDNNLTLPIAAIVSITLGLYVVLMFLIVTCIRCYCGKQCTNLRCICGSLCSCQPFIEGEEPCSPTAIRIITCSCINFGKLCQSPKKKDIDWVGIFFCDKCFGPGGPCACDNCDVECAVDCKTINCFCFQIHNGTQSSTSFNNNYSNNASSQIVKYPPLPSTGRSITSYPESSTTAINSLLSVRSSDSEAKSTQTPRSLYENNEVLPLSTSSRLSSKSVHKASVVPETNSKLFTPRSQAFITKDTGYTPKSTKSSIGKKKKVSETKVESFDQSQQRNNSVKFSPDVSMSNQSALSQTAAVPMTSSGISSTNSLSATSEALLAQYQLMDAEKLTSTSEETPRY